ncbi:hypothetical protein C1645_826085 [Glomus cerebriforme]|uniref:Uncharacterized protein n=1 Tax=Glomus cerebriforme TaxID=658196 RepID=A0A397SR68_9GLOM|nr:hypothetical protein C1645_826085 [Glomus cerebriforme]
MSLNCHCYSCNIKYPSNTYIISSNNEDEQNLIMQICKRIFESIQLNHNSTEISYDGNKMLHGQIRNINEVENCINKEFNQLFESKLLDKEIKKLPIGIWRIGFKWDEFNNDTLIKGLLKISRKSYSDFSRYLQSIDSQKRNINEEKLKKHLIDNLEGYLPGVEYLFECTWKSYDDNNNCYEGEFIFASNSGIFIVVGAKWLNVKCGRNTRRSINLSRNDVKDQALNHKDKASEEFNGKYVALLGATFTNDLDMDSSENPTFEFINNDGVIAQHLKEICDFSRRYDGSQTPLSYDSYNSYNSYNNQATISVQQAAQEGSVMNTGIIAKIAAAAAAGYVIYQTFSRNNKE